MRADSRLRVATAVLALLLVGVACGDDGGVTGSTEAITFGEGTIPDSVPGNFPIPDGSVVGTTLVDKINNRTEFRLTIRAETTATIRFFQVGLVNQGYVINSSEGNAAEWTLIFSDGELRGTIFTTPQGQGLTSSVISLNRS
ncbi:MAG: hypothetical protein IH941_09430 [Acidobacteria bacterium]|nr:hypothetical protein [Acidobacteriota bacterium]